MVPVEKDGSSLYKTRVLLPDGLTAPITAGQTCGGGGGPGRRRDPAGQIDLLAMEDVDQATVGFYIKKLFRNMT